MTGFAQTDDADPYLWLEEIESPRAIAQVKERNKATEDLLTANFDGPDAVSAATDEDLLKIDGIGPKVLKKIREVYPQAQA